MLKNKIDVVEAEKSIKRKNKAQALIADLKKKRSDWYYRKTIEALYPFLDLEFVRKALIEFYFKTENEKLKEMVKSFHDGNFDDEELREELEYYADLEAANQEVYDNFLAQIDADEIEFSESKNSVYNVKLGA